MKLYKDRNIFIRINIIISGIIPDSHFIDTLFTLFKYLNHLNYLTFSIRIIALIIFSRIFTTSVESPSTFEVICCDITYSLITQRKCFARPQINLELLQTQATHNSGFL